LTDAGATGNYYQGFDLPGATTRSYFVRFMARSFGGGEFGRVFQHATGPGNDVPGTDAMFLRGQNVNRLFFIHNYASLSTGQYGSDVQIIPGRWYSAGVTHDRRATLSNGAADIKAYINGIRTGVYENAASGGQTYVRGVNTNWVIGDRPSDLARSWDGQHEIVVVFDSLLSDAEHASLHANPWQVLEPTARSMGRVAAVTVYRPGSDLIVNGWTAVGAGSLAAAMADASNATYAESPNLTDPATETWDAPLPAGTYDISVTFDRTAADGQLRLVLLDSGGGTVGTSAWQAAPAIFATTVFNVTTTDTSDRFRIEVQP
jgi:hypothetical protein